MKCICKLVFANIWLPSGSARFHRACRWWPPPVWLFGLSAVTTPCWRSSMNSRRNTWAATTCLWHPTHRIPCLRPGDPEGPTIPATLIAALRDDPAVAVVDPVVQSRITVETDDEKAGGPGRRPSGPAVGGRGPGQRGSSQRGPGQRGPGNREVGQGGLGQDGAGTKQAIRPHPRPLSRHGRGETQAGGQVRWADKHPFTTRQWTAVVAIQSDAGRNQRHEATLSDGRGSVDRSLEIGASGSRHQQQDGQGICRGSG